MNRSLFEFISPKNFKGTIPEEKKFVVSCHTPNLIKLKRQKMDALIFIDCLEHTRVQSIHLSNRCKYTEPLTTGNTVVENGHGACY